jgi:uncharacterized protein YutE (UPF0331/DUF86 family)
MTLDKQLVVRKAKLIKKDLDKLANIKPKDLKAYLKDENTQLVTERLLERVVGRMIDINYHVLKNEFDFMPSDFKQSFTDLGTRVKAPGKLIEEVSKSSGLRNVLAHEYEEIDPQKVYQSIDKALTQIPKYLDIILSSL